MCRHHHHTRRATLALLAATPFLSACKAEAAGPEDIRWGREVCEICGMIISDPGYASEIRGGPDRKLVKFDDIGDAINWLKEQPWKDDPSIEFWVRDYGTRQDWLDARQAHYQRGVISPMDYGFAALSAPSTDSISFEEMRRDVLARGLTWRCIPGGEDGEGHKG
ncbi:hypothetical protein E7681_06990 [Thalassobius vesicularis]|uniref:Protein NosL n=1 Tax=Thalassobius vesicularis TaxID=1294297 RepID=A0A4S3M9H2_9RHOB|nr:nitrous oxide reductase accessory protein NosL [Thalassobius vesicularis]THD74710.1 hypothetical protein E7681_06990 [Thalassobius vesicularis]